MSDPVVVPTPLRRERPDAVPRLVAGSLFVAAIVVIAAVAAWPIYRSGWFLLLVGVSAVVAAGLAVVARLRRWDGWMTTASVAAAFFVLGVPLAVPSRLGGPLELLRGLGDLGTGLVLAWKDLVTVDLPVGTYRNLLVPALVVFLVGTCATLLLSWREDRAAYAAAPIGLAMVSFGLFFGRTETSAPLPLGPVTLYAPVETAIGISALVVTLLWLAWRNREERVRALQRAAASSGVRISRRPTRADRRRGALGAGMLVIAVAAGAVVVPYAARGADRDVLRSAFGPEIDLAAEVSPLSSYRALFADDRADEVLFTVDVESGSPSRIRLATLDSYDGEVFRAGGADAVDDAQFVRVPATLDAGDGRAARTRISIEGLDGIWMPTVGRLQSVDFAGDRAAALADSFYYSAEAAAGVETAGDGLKKGDSYLIRSIEPGLPDLAAIRAPGGVDSSIAVPESLATWVERHATGSDGVALQGLVKLLRERGYLSHGLLPEGETPVWASSLPDYAPQASASGHSLARIDTLFSKLLERETDPRAEASGNFVAGIGDDEQFAVAVALIARQLGFPSRVVVGARLDSTDPGVATCDDGACRAQDLSAWAEVQDDAGEWIPVDATPQYADSPSLEVTEQRDPENVTEVRPDSVEEVLPPDPVQEDSGVDDDVRNDAGPDLAWLWSTLRTSGVVLAILVLALGPFLAVIIAKAVRRRGRRTQGPPAARVAGGWDEYVDAAVDAGRGAPRALTRSEVASAYATDSGLVLAERADRAVFSGATTTLDEAEEFWRIVDEERRGLARGEGFWRRVLATVSLRSFIRPLAPMKGRRERTAERGKRRAVPRERTSP
ncbi:transglutaminase domain-containing protein [Microbacterium sp. 4R-513]|uniref:transglutaminase domain-containing protein n=1 Tax=Microbacterium sp. 4R-513 TaxID=2567934 RepID=UPI0013E17FB0|nr:transglutaminase domain-containing protein [Microbacterium sp. 4R-513]QIG38602.1 transglutaminase domain-containing protein [Microbacterium sp. 4R-513]